MSVRKKFFLFLYSSILFLFIWAVPVKETSGEEFVKVINVTDFGVNGNDTLDDRDLLQKAFNEVPKYGGGLVKVVIPDGDYYVSKQLRLHSNTYLQLSPNARIIRNDSYSPMLMNYTSGAKGYSANENITVDGGIWEGNMDQFPTPFDNILFGHAENITVKNTKVLNNYEGHQIEFAGVRNGKVLNNYIEGYAGAKKKEAIQIDIISDEIAFPPFGDYDNTPCVDILVEGNEVVNHSRGVGSHTAVEGIFHKNITIQNNTFTNLMHEGIDAYNFNDLMIKNNTFTNVGLGIEYLPGSFVPSDGYRIEISGNIISGTKTTVNTIGNGIMLEGKPNFPLSNIKIENNSISNCENDGIYLQNTNNTTVTNNTITGCKRHGMSVSFNSNKNTITKNIIKDSGSQGITIFQDSSLNTIKENQITNSKGNGISLNEGAKSNILSSNVVSVSGKNGIFIGKNSNENQVIQNQIIQAVEKGILLMGESGKEAQKNIIQNNKIDYSSQDGILGVYASYNTISGNKVLNSKNAGISLNHYSKKNQIISNTVSTSGTHGVILFNHSSATLTKNTISSSKQNGISISQYSSGVLDSNVVKNSVNHGISVYLGSKVTAKKNTISYSTQNGISVSVSSSNNTLSYNTVTESKKHGISFFDQSSGNIINNNTVLKSGEHGLVLNKNITASKIYGNTIQASSQKGSQLFDQLIVADYCSGNTIEKNTLKYGKDTKKARYGIHLTSLSSKNTVKSNNIKYSGMTKDLHNKGTANVVSGNY